VPQEGRASARPQRPGRGARPCAATRSSAASQRYGRAEARPSWLCWPAAWAAPSTPPPPAV